MKETYDFGYSTSLVVTKEDDAFKIEDRLTEQKRKGGEVCKHMSAFHYKKMGGSGGYCVRIFMTSALPINVGASKLDAIVKWSEMKKALTKVINEITEGIDISLD